MPTRSPRRPWAVAGIVALMVLLGISITLPVLGTDRALQDPRVFSILTGILEFVHGGKPLLALLVFAFSVVFPMTKLVAILIQELVTVDRGDRQRLLRWLEILGKWSMLDVFVVVVTFGAMRLGILASAEPRPGIYLFGAVILLSILATAIYAHRHGVHSSEPDVRPTPSLVRRHPWRVDVPLAALASLAGLWVGLTASFLSVEKWVFWENDYSVLDAVLQLLNTYWILGALTLVFVIALPALRSLLVLPLWLGAVPASARAATVRGLRRIDEWSMGDVFLLAVLVVGLRMVPLAEITVRVGGPAFLLAVASGAYASWQARRLAVR